MLRTLTVCLVLMVSAAWLQAQGQPGSTDPSSASQGASAQTSASASGETSVEGCLQGSSGSFTLTDNSGMTYTLAGDTSKLAEHVGHEVKIKGTTSASNSGMSSGSGSSSAGTSAGASSGASSSLDVKSVKMVSKTCKSAGK